MRLERLLLAGTIVVMGSSTSAQSKSVVWPSAATKWADSPAAAGAKGRCAGAIPPRGRMAR